MDREMMRRTLKKVLDVWQWDRCWGWDFPMAAMTAAKLGEPELAIRALMIDSPKNRYLPNGHVYQRPDLTAYLPANGGLLAAVAMMASAGAFPRDGKWVVQVRGISVRCFKSNQVRPRSLFRLVRKSSTLSFLIPIVGMKICLPAGMTDLSPPMTLARLIMD